MNHLVIGIPTYKRPAMLAKLVRSIYNCERNDRLIGSIDLLIVDNDKEASAKKIAEEIKLECPVNFGFQYHNFTEKGLSKVRNEILSKASEMAPDYIVFVDDDEYVAPDWLNELVSTVVEHEAEIAQGPNIPVFEEETIPYLACWQQHMDFEHHTEIKDFETNNAIVKMKFITDNNLVFDERFNVTGGEDSFFGIQAMKKGAKNIWSKKAIVYENIPAARTKLKWLFKRIYRGATTYSYTLKLEKDYLGLLKKFIVSILYIIVGFLTLPTILFPFKKKYWSFFKLVEGVGGLAGLLSIRYKEYL